MNNNLCFSAYQIFCFLKMIRFCPSVYLSESNRFDLEGDEQAQSGAIVDYKSLNFRFSRLFTSIFILVEVNGLEPMASCVQGRRSPNWATPPMLTLETRLLTRLLKPLLVFRFSFAFSGDKSLAWWAWMELNHRPHAYQACALTELSYRPIGDRAYFILIDF